MQASDLLNVLCKCLPGFSPTEICVHGKLQNKSPAVPPHQTPQTQSPSSAFVSLTASVFMCPCESVGMWENMLPLDPNALLSCPGNTYLCWQQMNPVRPTRSERSTNQGSEEGAVRFQGVQPETRQQVYGVVFLKVGLWERLIMHTLIRRRYYTERFNRQTSLAWRPRLKKCVNHFCLLLNSGCNISVHSVWTWHFET